MYQFDNLIPFIVDTRRLSDRRYYDWNDSISERRTKAEALEFKLWVLKVAAAREADANHEILRQRALAAGFTHMVYARRGLQFLMSGKRGENELESMINSVLDQQYYDAVNQCYEKVNSHAGDSPISRYYTFSANDEGSMAAFREWRIGTYTVQDRYGLWKLDTDTRIRGRQNILEAFWNLGFLTLRGRILQAAVKDFGSKADILAMPDVRAIADRLPLRSPMRINMLTGMRKVHRDCDWPRGLVA